MIKINESANCFLNDKAKTPFVATVLAQPTCYEGHYVVCITSCKKMPEIVGQQVNCPPNRIELKEE